MRRAVLHLEFVTPAFLGGAVSPAQPESTLPHDPDDTLASWRAASIRGQWRWWFRAVAGPVLGNDPRELAAAETRLFGSTDNPSRLQIRAEPTDLRIHPVGDRLSGLQRHSARQLATSWSTPEDQLAATVDRLTVRHKGREVDTNTVAYLAYGCMDYKGVLTRSCISPESTTRIVLQWHEERWRTVDSSLRQLAARSLRTWLHLGGIGSKCRKGFGSLRLTKVDGELPFELDPPPYPMSREELLRTLHQLRGSAATDQPRWTQLSTDSRLHLGPNTTSWQEALDRVAGWLIAFRRRYGIRADVRPKLQDRDYEWHKGRLKGQGSPDRAGFGLPLPFGKGGPVATAVPGGSSDGSLRRASPLHVHVESLAPGAYVAVLARLGGAFLPDGAHVQFSGGQVGHRTDPPTPRQLDVVDRFLDDLAAKDLISTVGAATPTG